MENSLFCEKHSSPATNPINEEEVIMAMIYVEDQSFGNFTRYELTHFEEKPILVKSENILYYNYTCDSSKTDFNFENSKSKSKITQDFKTNNKLLHEDKQMSLMDILLQLITGEEWRNTTFICQDDDSLTYVS